MALIVFVALAVFALMDGGGGDGETSVGPSAVGEVSVDGPARPGEPFAVGEAVPGFSGPAIDGGTVRWTDFEGPTVLSVWAPWCPHCQVELPLLGRVMQDFPEIEFVTVVTSIGTNPGPDAGEFLRENGITAPTLIDDENGTAAAALGIRGFPTLYLVDGEGLVAYMGEGEVGEDELRSLLSTLG
ncbi:MAG TPA: TlpA disulfide reductase family protein [Actinomycetota bacterium]|nr:TlpA disulfide reductase family protein [Actinomycetota bacterium]